MFKVNNFNFVKIKIVNFEQVNTDWVIYKSNMSNVNFVCSIWAILWVPLVNCSLKLLNEEK